MFRSRKIGLISLAAMCVGIASYSGVNSKAFSQLFGSDSEIASVMKDLPKDIKGVFRRVYEVLGNPRDNFRQAMTGFENAAHQNNPHSRGHGDYSRIYEMLDINNIISQLKNLKLKEYEGQPDSVIIRDSYMPSYDDYGY